MDHSDGNPFELNYQASSAALDALTGAALNHEEPPEAHIHAPAHIQGEKHKWIHKLFPPEVADFYENKYHMGNFVIDRQTGQKSWESMSIYVRVGMHLLYYGTEQEKALHWKRVIALLKSKSEKMGKEYDNPASKSHIKPFIESFGLRDSMKEMVKPNPDDYATFNEFFAREIREDARPIVEPENELVTSSPADCRLAAFPTIDLATKYWIKGHDFTLAKLVNDAELAKDFDGGSMVIARLAPQDYHRFHAPVSGTVESITETPGAYYTVNPQAINQPGVLNVFCENKRSIMVVRRTPTNAKIAVVAVGAMLVGSIFYVEGMDQTGAQMKRGQCIGGFKYGGSTVIVLYPPGEVHLDEDLVRNSIEQSCETLMHVGWRVGIKE